MAPFSVRLGKAMRPTFGPGLREVGSMCKVVTGSFEGTIRVP